ncbi:hypothetical protein FGG08_001658 [Glutinoglossum americanum]|uniref:DUF7721 domain-containing protein n=1 Tax=Glutinoglossum americanum TaxID=1670608 RepID=A0A9P8IGL7_9PEZI|nr:hypothetical protein FGG08_001658 [Glutinoglossum americanum]
MSHRDDGDHRSGGSGRHYAEGRHHHSGDRGNDDYKKTPHTGESSSYYNPSNTFADEPPPPQAQQYQEEESSHDQTALHHAQHHSSSSTPPCLFTTALHHLGQIQKQHSGSPHSVDESAFVSAHQTVYNQQGSQQTEQHAAPTLGMAAAMNALKTFTSHGEGGGKSNSQSEFIGLAMAQAGKLFDEQSHAGKVVRHPSKTKQTRLVPRGVRRPG